MGRCPERLAWALTATLACVDEGGDELEPQQPPGEDELAEIQAWLVAGAYLDWELHEPTTTPELPGLPGGSRVYLSPELAASMAEGAASHPLGAAAVREIFDATDPEVQLGFAYMIKLEPEPQPDAWFFYEVFSLEVEGEPLVAERGAPGCVGCHQDGLDHVF